MPVEHGRDVVAVLSEDDVKTGVQFVVVLPQIGDEPESLPFTQAASVLSQVDGVEDPARERHSPG